MNKQLEALKEAVCRAPLLKPVGLSPEWQAYFDAVTPLHVSALIANLEQAQSDVDEANARNDGKCAQLCKQDEEIAMLKQRIAELEVDKLRLSSVINTVANRADAAEASPLAVKLQQSEATEITDCDQEVYEKGVSACLVEIPKEVAEIICKGISAASGCKVDWHYFGGRVHIKAIRAAGGTVEGE